MKIINKHRKVLFCFAPPPPSSLTSVASAAAALRVGLFAWWRMVDGGFGVVEGEVGGLLM